MDDRGTLKTNENESTKVIIGDVDVHAPRVMAISSGKGGVGKTSCVINLAVAFAMMNRRVLIFDADLGLGNVVSLLGLTAEYNVGHLLRGERAIEEVMITGPLGIMIIPSSGGEQEFTRLGTNERHALVSYLEGLQASVDVMLIDTGSGISDNVLFFNAAAKEIIIVVSPEQASVAAAEALMSALNKKHGERRFNLLVNVVKSEKEGREVYKRLLLGVERRLDVFVDYVGPVLKDEHVGKAAGRARAVIDAFPQSKASRCFIRAARALDEMPVSSGLKGGLQFMWQRTFKANCRISTIDGGDS